jgi:hypothetical protein
LTGHGDRIDQFSLFATIWQRCAANDSCPPEFTMNQSTVITQFVAYATTVANIRRELLAVPGMRRAVEPVHEAAEKFYERALAYAAHALEVCVNALDDAYMEACDQATSRDQIPALMHLKLDAWRRGSARVMSANAAFSAAVSPRIP